MKSIPAALTWELFQRGKWTLPGAFLTGNALAMVVLAALRRDGAINPEDRSMIEIHVTMLFVNATVFGAALFCGHGKPFAAARVSRAELRHRRVAVVAGNGLNGAGVSAEHRP